LRAKDEIFIKALILLGFPEHAKRPEHPIGGMKWIAGFYNLTRHKIA